MHPAAAAALPKVGYFRQFSAEGVLSLAPGLVIANHEAGPAVALERLRDAVVPVIVLGPARDLDDGRVGGNTARRATDARVDAAKHVREVLGEAAVGHVEDGVAAGGVAAGQEVEVDAAGLVEGRRSQPFSSTMNLCFLWVIRNNSTTDRLGGQWTLSPGPLAPSGPKPRSIDATYRPFRTISGQHQQKRGP